MPWSLLNNAEELQPKKANQDSVGFYQTHVCKFPLNSFIIENLNNKDIEIVNDISSSVECFNKINGADFIEAKVRKGLAKKLKWNDTHSYVTLKL